MTSRTRIANEAWEALFRAQATIAGTKMSESTTASSASLIEMTMITPKKIPSALTTVGTEKTISTLRAGGGGSSAVGVTGSARVTVMR